LVTAEHADGSEYSSPTGRKTQHAEPPWNTHSSKSPQNSFINARQAFVHLMVLAKTRGDRSPRDGLATWGAASAGRPGCLP
jgi:hypothetical protein